MAPLKIAVVVAVAFAYMRLAAPVATLDHAIAVGVAWLAFNIAAELITAAVIGHSWYELIGSPQHEAWRNSLMLAWLAAPATFARYRSTSVPSSTLR